MDGEDIALCIDTGERGKHSPDVAPRRGGGVQRVLHAARHDRMCARCGLMLPAWDWRCGHAEQNGRASQAFRATASSLSGRMPHWLLPSEALAVPSSCPVATHMAAHRVWLPPPSTPSTTPPSARAGACMPWEGGVVLGGVDQRRFDCISQATTSLTDQHPRDPSRTRRR